MLLCAPADDYDDRILRGEFLFLGVLLNSPDGTGTLADATPKEYLTRPYEDGGRWRGSIPKRLAGRGIVGHVPASHGLPTAHKSPRKARRSGLASVWRLLDANLGRQRFEDLKLRLSSAVRRQRGLFDDLGPAAI